MPERTLCTPMHGTSSMAQDWGVSTWLVSMNLNVSRKLV